MNYRFLIFTMSLFFFSLLSCTKFVSKKNQKLVYCSEGSPTFFNPQVSADGPSFDASRDIYNRLIKVSAKGDNTLQSSLAKSWSVSKNKLVYIFKLRKNVSFHQTSYFKPTRFFNADDVIFSFHRQMKKDHKYHLINGGNYMYFTTIEMGSLIKSIKKIDNYTIKITLNRVESIFLRNLAMEFMSILSKEYATQLLKLKKPEDIDFIPIGTGPFIFKQYVKDSVVRLDRNPQYFLGPSRLTGIVISIVPDSSVRVQKLKVGECDIIAQPSPLDYEAIKKHSNTKLVGGPAYNVAYLAMNVTKKPFNNVKVRRAINHALRRSLYMKAIYHNQASIAKNPFPSILWSYNNDVKDYEYSIQKSRLLLKQAGYEKGFKTTLWTLPISRPYNPNGKKMGELMQADLQKVGIQVQLVSYDWSTYMNRAGKGEHDMIQLGWTSDTGDPDSFLRALLSCSSVDSGLNVARWCNPQFDKLIKKALLVFGRKNRSILYKKAQVIFKAQAPWVTLAHTYNYLGMLKKVQGYQVVFFGSKSFYTVYLKN